MALAPILVAFLISLSKESLRAFSASEVYDVTSPPKIPSIPANDFSAYTSGPHGYAMDSS